MDGDFARIDSRRTANPILRTAFPRWPRILPGILLATAAKSAHDLVLVMTPRPRIRRRRSSSRHGQGSTPGLAGALAALVTTFLLATILISGPLILGADRLWIELPLLCATAFLLLLQGLRLTAKPIPETPRRVDAIDLAVVLFVVYAIVRWLTSPAEYFSRIEVMDVIAYAGIFFTCRYGMKNRKYCMTILYAVVALGLGETAFGYYLVNHLDWLPFGPAETLQLHYAPRWIGTYESPNHYASLLVMAVGVALALGSFSKLPWAVRIILFYVALMMIIGLMFSGSRGGWLALLAVIFALAVMGIRNGAVRWWIPVGSALALLLVSAFLFSITPVVQTRLAESKNLLVGSRPDASARVQMAADALRVAHDHLLFGTGPGASVFIHPLRTEGAPDAPLEPAHDDYLNCLDDYGLVGLALALFFIAAVTLKFFRPLWVDNRWQDRVLVAAGFAAWMALLVHSLVGFNLHIPGNAVLFFSLTGLALGRIKEEREGHWSTLSLNPLGRGLGVAALVFTSGYGVEVARTALSDNIYEKALARADVVPVSESLGDAGDSLSYDSGNVQDWAFSGDLHRLRAALQKDNATRLAEAQKALDAYQNALQENPLDASVQTRIEAVREWMRKNSEAPAGAPANQ
jgi:O-antigen ligase